MKLIVTGFDPFGGERRNPSQSIVELLPRHMTMAGRSIEIVAKVLPTCGAQAWRQFVRVLKRADENDVVVHLGLAEARTKVNLERFALNIRDYRIKDNRGQQIEGQAISSTSPVALKTGVDLRALSRRLNKKRFPCEISNHAGTFICNELYFRTLDFQRKNGLPGTVLFVHLPKPETYFATASSGVRKRKRSLRSRRSAGLALMQAAVQEILHALSA